MKRVNEKAIRTGRLGVIRVSGPIATPLEFDMRKLMNQEIDNALMNARYKEQALEEQAKELANSGRSIRSQAAGARKSYFTKLLVPDDVLGVFPIHVISTTHMKYERSAERGISQLAVYKTMKQLERMCINGDIDLLSLPSGQNITIRDHRQNITVVSALHLLDSGLDAKLIIITVHNRSSFGPKPHDYVVDIHR